MNATEKRIAELSYELSMINFQEHLSSEDYKRMSDIKEEIKLLENQRHGWYVEIEYKDATYKISKEAGYLTSDRILCFSDEPTYFESVEEAEEHIKNADIGNHEEYIFTIKEKRESK